MKHFVAYDPATDEIVQTGSTTEIGLVRMAAARPTLIIVEGKGNDLEHRVRNGKIERRTAKQIAARKAADAAKDTPPKKSKIERVLSYLKKQGIDLGPDGADL